jgi:hypothetical protein
MAPFAQLTSRRWIATLLLLLMGALIASPWAARAACLKESPAISMERAVVSGTDGEGMAELSAEEFATSTGLRESEPDPDSGRAETALQVTTCTVAAALEPNATLATSITSRARTSIDYDDDPVPTPPANPLYQPPRLL